MFAEVAVALALHAGQAEACPHSGPDATTICGDRLQPVPSRGKEIYTRGEGTALVGETRVSAAIVPCASCHGGDGRGRAEGGVRPADIRRAALTKPYASPYDDRLLRRAITSGISSGGRTLNPVMPRYQFARADLDALVAYLHLLGDEAVPGVTDTTIRVAVVLPPGQRAAIEAWVNDFNTNGGVYGRKLEIATGDVFGTLASLAETADSIAA